MVQVHIQEFVDGSFNNPIMMNYEGCVYQVRKKGGVWVEGWTAVHVTYIYSTVYVSLSERSGHLAFRLLN